MQKKAHQPYLPYLESSSAGEKFPRAITPQKALMNMPFRSREKARYGQIDVKPGDAEAAKQFAAER